jgi:hypothetical protein
VEIYLAFLYCVVLSHLTRSQHKDILENSGGVGGDGRNEGPLDRTRLVVKGGLLRPRPLMGVKYIRDAWIERSLQLRFSFSVDQNFQTLLPSPIRLRIYGSSGERSMVNINGFFAQQSRFNSHWVGPTTTEALEWEEQHGTNYYTPLAPGPFLVAQRHGLGGGADVFGPAMINWAALRAANQAFDDEASRKHEADMELNTGTVTPDTPIRAISQSGPPIRESDATIREWELLYESGVRLGNQGPDCPIG